MCSALGAAASMWGCEVDVYGIESQFGAAWFVSLASYHIEQMHVQHVKPHTPQKLALPCSTSRPSSLKKQEGTGRQADAGSYD